MAVAEAECESAAQELTKYAGLPPDLAAAKAVHAELQARLQQLRAEVAEGLQVLE